MADLLPRLQWLNAIPRSPAELDLTRTPGFYEVVDPAGVPAGTYQVMVLKSGKSGDVKIKQIMYNANTTDTYVRNYTPSGGFTAPESAGGGGSSTAGVQPSATTIRSAIWNYGLSLPTLVGCAVSENGDLIDNGFSGLANKFSQLLYRRFVVDAGSSPTFAGVEMEGADAFLKPNLRWGGIFSFQDDAFAEPEMFLGLSSDVGNTDLINGGVASLLHLMGIAVGDGDLQLKFIHNDGSGAANLIPCEDATLGAMEWQTDAVYELYCELVPPGEINFRLTRLNDGAEATHTATTDLPEPSSPYVMHWNISNLATDEAVEGNIHSMWVQHGDF